MSESAEGQPAAPAAKDEDKAAAAARAVKGKDKDKAAKGEHANCSTEMADSAAKNWSGLVNLCLGQEREKRGNGSQRTSLAKPGGVVSPFGMGPQQKPALRFMPTYRLESKNPLNRERVEIIMKTVMNQHYNDEYQFHPKHSLHLSSQVSEEIKNRIKLMNYDRYRYIVVVTVGENLMQGLYAMVNFLWDATKDGYVTYKVEQPSYYALCTTFYIYYD